MNSIICFRMFLPDPLQIRRAAKRAFGILLDSKTYLLEGVLEKVQMNRRGTFRLTLNRMVAVGRRLEPGQTLYCYLAKDKEERPFIAIYLDGRPRGPEQCSVCGKREVHERGVCRSCLNGFRSKYSERDVGKAVRRFDPGNDASATRPELAGEPLPVRR